MLWIHPLPRTTKNLFVMLQHILRYFIFHRFEFVYIFAVFEVSDKPNMCYHTFL